MLQSGNSMRVRCSARTFIYRGNRSRRAKHFTQEGQAVLRVIVFSGVVLSCALFAVFGGEILPSAAVPLPDALSPYIAHDWSRMAIAAVLLVATLFVLDAVFPALLD